MYTNDLWRFDGTIIIIDAIHVYRHWTSVLNHNFNNCRQIILLWHSAQTVNSKAIFVQANTKNSDNFVITTVWQNAGKTPSQPYCYAKCILGIIRNTIFKMTIYSRGNSLNTIHLTPGPNFIELLNQKILVNNILISWNEQDTQIVHVTLHSLAGNLFLVAQFDALCSA